VGRGSHGFSSSFWVVWAIWGNNLNSSFWAIWVSWGHIQDISHRMLLSHVDNIDRILDYEACEGKHRREIKE